MVVLDTTRISKDFLNDGKHSLLICSDNGVVTCGDAKTQGIINIFDYKSGNKVSVDTSCRSVNYLQAVGDGYVIGCNSNRVFVIKNGCMELERSFPTISFMTVTESNDICIEIISDGFVIYLNRFLETTESNTDYLVSSARPICVRSGELSTRSGDKIRVRSVAYDDGNLKLFLGPHLLNYVTMDQTSNQVEFSNLGQLHGQSAMFIAYANKILIIKTEDLIQTTLKTFTHKIVSFILIEKKNIIVAHCENSKVYVIQINTEVSRNICKEYEFNQKVKCISMSEKLSENEFFVLFESGSVQVQSL